MSNVIEALGCSVTQPISFLREYHDVQVSDNKSHRASFYPEVHQHSEIHSSYLITIHLSISEASTLAIKDICSSVQHKTSLKSLGLV